MDPKQMLCLESALNGHNILLIGQAGTGKTYTIKECVKRLRSAGKNVALTCYTGIACLQYQGLGATTLHKFSGLEDGRHGNEDLVHLVNTDERFSATKSKILSTDVFIVDEVSMVSKKIFESVEYVCRSLRGNTYFGGIQVIISGDFYQLPPIKDQLYGDSGHNCFEASFFHALFPHTIYLTKVHRQPDNALISCINELERGAPSEKPDELMKVLSRPLGPEYETNAVRLYARNYDVDIFNYKQLQSVNNPLKVFNADDTCESFYLNKFMAPKRLGVKVDAPVMLLRNLNDRHVNCLVGRVTKIDENYIRMLFEFEDKSEEINVSRYTFTKIDPITKSCLAKRCQFPLKLAYSMTIHKSQGMGLKAVEIACKNATNPGQIGVAVGRALSVDRLRVMNYKPSLCRRHPDKIGIFYESIDSTSEVLLIGTIRNVYVNQPTFLSLGVRDKAEDIFSLGCIIGVCVESTDQRFYRVTVFYCFLDLFYV